MTFSKQNSPREKTSREEKEFLELFAKLEPQEQLGVARLLGGDAASLAADLSKPGQEHQVNSQVRLLAACFLSFTSRTKRARRRLLEVMRDATRAQN